MGQLPQLPSLEQLRIEAKVRKRDRGIALSVAQHELAGLYGFDSWPELIQRVQTATPNGVEQALMVADVAMLTTHLSVDPAAATRDIDGASAAAGVAAPVDRFVRRCPQLRATVARRRC